MQRVQRKFGSFLPRTADDSQVAALIHEFNETDKVLAALIEAAEKWRDDWTEILNKQTSLAQTFETLYGPMWSKDDTGEGHALAETPQATMERASSLKTTYEELKKDMALDIKSIDGMFITPAIDSKQSIYPLKNVIKKREDKKLDYERYKSRVEAVVKKLSRSERDELALQKHEADLSQATAAYEAADAHLRKILPPITAAAQALLPHLLSAQVSIQYTFLAHLYTAVHNYCQGFNFPSNVPEASEVVATWDCAFTPLRKEVESSLNVLITGKAVHKPIELNESSSSGSITGLNIRDSFAQRRTSNQNSISKPVVSPPIHRDSETPLNDGDPRPKISSLTSSSLANRSRISSFNSANPNINNAATALANPSNSAESPGRMSVSQYTSPKPRRESSGSHFGNGALSHSPPTASMPSISGAIGKKKPPPPPPPKRLPSTQSEWVTALYDFDGQSAGDLSFKAGDRIRVLKKTESTMDWWDGECRGQKGAFPANYCGVG